MVTIPKVEFYINHTCNLTCNNCNRFNNYNFKGWQSFYDYEAQLEKWAEYIQIEKIVIMGGEPFLNPTLTDWVKGLNRIFNKNVQILTNGTRLNKVKGLFELLVDPVGEDCVSNWVGISLHNIDYYETLIKDLNQFLQVPEDYCLSELIPKENVKMGEPSVAIGKNGVSVHIYLQNEFSPAAVRTNSNGRLTLHNSNPEDAHSKCEFVQYKSYHMIEAKLYKCGPSALFPEFDKQFNLDISEEDRKLINSYRPLSVNDVEIQGEEFFALLDNPIPQCKFCPVRGHDKIPDIIYPTVKGKTTI